MVRLSTPGTAGRTRVVGFVLLAGLLSGCSGQGSAEDDAVRVATVRFVRAVAQDPAAACRMLAPGTRKAVEESGGGCSASLADQLRSTSGEVGRSEVYGKDAIVHLIGDTVFLARFRQGWLVTAAGCTAQGESPYSCTVEGG